MVIKRRGRVTLPIGVDCDGSSGVSSRWTYIALLVVTMSLNGVVSAALIVSCSICAGVLYVMFCVAL